MISSGPQLITQGFCEFFAGGGGGGGGGAINSSEMAMYFEKKSLKYEILLNFYHFIISHFFPFYSKMDQMTKFGWL